MSTYYVSLVRGLQGCFVEFKAPSEDAVRQYCLNYMGKMWCSVYTALPTRGGRATVINNVPIVIEEDGLYE